MLKLDAVNFIARRVLGTTLPALDTGGHSAAADMERAIDEQLLLLLSRGWSFNTFYETMTPDGSSHVIFDTHTIKQWPNPLDSDRERNLQRRGDQLYDMDKDSDTDLFDAPVKMTLVRLIGWDCTPEPFRQWIAASAAARYNEWRGFNQKQGILDRDELKAKVEAERYEQRARHGSSLQTPEAAAIRGFRNRFGSPVPGWW